MNIKIGDSVWVARNGKKFQIHIAEKVDHPNIRFRDVLGRGYPEHCLYHNEVDADLHLALSSV